MKPGVYDELTNAEYHGGEGVSKSMLDVLAQSSPLHLYHLRNAANDNERQPTAAQQIGTAFHALLLEPELFTKEYCLALRQQDAPDAIADKDTLVAMVAKLNETRLPKLSTTGTKDELTERVLAEVSGYDDVDATGMRELKLAELKAIITKENERRPALLSDKGTMSELRDILNANGHQVVLWPDVKAQWLENNGHRNVLDQETWEQLHRMRDAVMAHQAARKLLTAFPGKAERSVYWIDPETGVLCRCRPDYWRQDGIIVDVKTTLDASAEGFAKSVSNYRYHVQHAAYVDGVNNAIDQMQDANVGEEFPADIPGKIRAFVFLAVEKTACVVNGQAKGVATYMLDAESVQLGRAEYRRDMNVYAKCQQTGDWPGYGNDIQSLSVPGWYLNKNAAIIDAA